MSNLKQWREALEAVENPDYRKYFHFEMMSIVICGEEEIKKIKEELQLLTLDHTNTLKTLDSAVRFNGSKNRIIERLEEVLKQIMNLEDEPHRVICKALARSALNIE